MAGEVAVDEARVEKDYTAMLARMVDGSLPNFSGTLYLVGVDRVQLSRTSPVPVQSASIDYGLGLFEGEMIYRITVDGRETAAFFHPVANLDRLFWGARTKGYEPPKYALEQMIGARMQLACLNGWIASDGVTITVNFGSSGKTDRVYVRSKLFDDGNGIGLGNPVHFEFGTTAMKVGSYLGEKAEREGAALFMPVDLLRQGVGLSEKSFSNYEASKRAREQMGKHNAAVQKKIAALREGFVKTLETLRPPAELTTEEYANIKRREHETEIARLESLICEDALMVQPDGRISEGTGENLFLVVKREGREVLVTPNIVEGKCLPGITRATTRALAEQLEIPVSEAMFTLPTRVLTQTGAMNMGIVGSIDMTGEEVVSAFMTGNFAGLVRFTRVIIPKLHYEADGSKVFEGDGEAVWIGNREGNQAFQRLKEAYAQVQRGERMPHLMERVDEWLTPAEISDLNEKGREIVRKHARADQVLEKMFCGNCISKAVAALEARVPVVARPRNAAAFADRVRLQRETIARGFQTVGMRGFAAR